MSDILLPMVAHPQGDENLGRDEPGFPVKVEVFGGSVHVTWDQNAPVTPMGQIVFFGEFLKTADLFDPWVEQCPLSWTSPNAPDKRNVLGSMMLSMLAGHHRYSHMTALRADQVAPQLFGMSLHVGGHTPTDENGHLDHVMAGKAMAWVRKWPISVWYLIESADESGPGQLVELRTGA